MIILQLHRFASRFSKFTVPFSAAQGCFDAILDSNAIFPLGERISALKFSVNDYPETFNLGWQSITNYESVKAELTNGYSLSKQEILKIYSITGFAGYQIGKTNEGKAFLIEASQILPGIKFQSPN